MPSVTFHYQTFKDTSQLLDSKKELLQHAEAICKNAYAPYSNFQVGCAVLLDNHQIISGANIENASSPVGICAERTALAYVVSNFPEQKIISIAIASHAQNLSPEKIIFPCGMCRQFILECQQRDNQPIELLLQSSAGQLIVIHDASHLLPFGFSSASLPNF